MNVDRVSQKAIEAYTEKSRAVGEATPAERTREVKQQERDEVSISQQALELQQARKAVEAVSDVREAKVEAIKKQIQNGSYNTPTEALVDKLLSVFKK